MIDFLTTILFFIVLIGVLVFVHEGGHFLFAKLFGVKVHVFSLGFGPRIFSFRKGETEYRAGWVPIGGYVKMLGEDPSEEVLPTDRGRAFGDKPLWQRLFIIVGGPAMNLAFPLFLHFGVGLSLNEVVPPEIGLVMPASPADRAGLRPGDRILAIDGREIGSFGDVVGEIAPRPGATHELTIGRGDERLTRRVTSLVSDEPFLLDIKKTVGRIGIGPGYLAPVVGVTRPDSPAGQAGIATFDRIIGLDGRPVTRFIELEPRLLAARGRAVRVELKRLAADARPPFAESFEKTTRTLSLAIPADAQDLTALGLESSADYVAWVDPAGAAHAVGLRRGDRLESLDGEILPLGQLFTRLDREPGRTHQLAFRRGAETFVKPFQPRFIPAGEAGRLGLARDAYDKGFYGLSEVLPPALIANPKRLRGALTYAVEETRNEIEVTILGFQLLFSGDISPRTIGGPIMIGQLAGMAGQQGVHSFIWMMALISINLGLINLLPLPVLDGGHVVFIAIEAVLRRPLRREIKERVLQFGVLLLIALFVFATWNDLARLVLG